MIYSYATKAWQCVLGCREGLSCGPNCWAKRTVNRLAHSPTESVWKAHCDLVVLRGGNLYWTGTVRLNEPHLLDPLKWRDPQIVAAGYHGDVGLLPDEALDRIFAVPALCPQHMILFLSKRVERLVEYFSTLLANEYDAQTWGFDSTIQGYAAVCPEFRRAYDAKWVDGDESSYWEYRISGPLPNVWIGTSASNQPEADERLPHLMKLAAAGWRTWVSLEPMVGAVDVRPWLDPPHEEVQVGEEEFLHRDDCPCNGTGQMPKLSWVVIGGESGKGARPFDIAWARAVRDQCAAAGVACYVKQLGARPFCGTSTLRGLRTHDGDDRLYLKLKDRSGSDPAEWPADLRVQQTPWEAHQ